MISHAEETYVVVVKVHSKVGTLTGVMKRGHCITVGNVGIKI